MTTPLTEPQKSTPSGEMSTINDESKEQTSAVEDILSPLLSKESFRLMDAPKDASSVPEFVLQKHIAYIHTLGIELLKETSYEGALTEHLRMSGVYWSLCALHMVLPSHAVNELMHVVPKDDVKTTTTTTDSNSNIDMCILDWVWTCYDEKSGGFGGNTGHPPHILYTLSALQIIVLSSITTDTKLEQNKFQILKYIASLQDISGTGAFAGDCTGEIDTRFTYCAFQSIVLLQQNQILHEAAATTDIDIERAVQHILQCWNSIDGGFGNTVGAESHAGQVFCCVGALAIAQSLHRIPDINLLGWWLSERQVDSGGLNGRAEKQADVCYSWWILSSLVIIGKLHWINTTKLAMFILKCQDTVDGGIADRPEDMVDVFHTYFGIGGLSLLGHLHIYDDDKNIDNDTTTTRFRTIDPIYALPTDVTKRLGLPGQIVTNSNDVTTTASDTRLDHYTVHTMS